MIHAFRDGELNFLTGRYASDYDTRAAGKQRAQDGVTELVGFVAGKKAERWGLEQLARADGDGDRAHILVNGFFSDGLDLSDKHIERKKLAKKDVPAFVTSWLERNQRREEDWISIAGPNRHFDALAGTRVDAIKVDGEPAGFAAHYSEGKYSYAAVFDANGKLLDGRTIVKAS